MPSFRAVYKGVNHVIYVRNSVKCLIWYCFWYCFESDKQNSNQSAPRWIAIFVLFNDIILATKCFTKTRKTFDEIDTLVGSELVISKPRRP
jgi:hypothetical protein